MADRIRKTLLLASLADAMGGEVLTRQEAASRLEGEDGHLVIVLDAHQALRLLEPLLREMLTPPDTDDSVLDTAQRQLVVDGRRVDLTKLEFEFFDYLYQRRGKVVARASLMCDVWGYQYTGGSNVIEALVRSIRRKLGVRAAIIETIRGVGYRYVDSSY